MAQSTSYRVMDEPLATGLSTVATNPVWPLLASMVAGAWLGWPWLAVNAFATGSPTRVRQLVMVTLAPLVSLAMLFAVVVARREEILPPAALPYCLVFITVWKLWVAYTVFLSQQGTFSLHQYFGGKVRNGMGLVVVGALLRSKVIMLVESVIWLVLVG